MPDVSITYNGEAIATMDASGTKTLNTQGKYCEGNIVVQYSKPISQMDCQIIDFTLATHQPADVVLGILSDEAYAHINDNSFAVSLINTTPDSIVDNDDYRIITSNDPNQPTFQSQTVQYGVGNRKVSTAVAVQNLACYYPPNSSDNSTSLGGIGKVWHDGKTLYYKSNSYFLAAGTYRVTISW